MYSAGSLGSLALYDATKEDHHVIRILGKLYNLSEKLKNYVLRQETRCMVIDLETSSCTLAAVKFNKF